MSTCGLLQKQSKKGIYYIAIEYHATAMLCYTYNSINYIVEQNIHICLFGKYKLFDR